MLTHMRIARHLSPSTNLPEFGVLAEDNFWTIAGNNPYENLELTGEFYPLEEVTLISPCAPHKIIGIALNFSGIQGYNPNMSEPLVFLKSPNTVTGPNTKVNIPFHSLKAWGEAELAVVIKRRASKIKRDSVDDYVLGFTIANDVTVSNIEGRDHHLARSKSVDGFCPIGPWIETDLTLSNLDINAFQNGELIRAGNTKDHHWNWREIVFQVSQWMCLEEGDVILTGNPPDINGWVYLEDEAKFEATISNIGTLTTYFSIADSKS
jgi:2-keto-4-pentenoate hydratase/2-oxohepta-3-ene-1,7-dioic acid hydratase in catechol pathway